MEIMMKRLVTLIFFVFYLLFNPLLHAETLLTTLQGEKISFSSLQGKWVLINYWASWCNPCLDEIAELNEFYDNNNEKVALFAVNYEGQSVREQRYVAEKLALRYPSLASDPAKELNLGGIRGVPATFVFNPQGQLSEVLYGPQTQKSLMRAVRQSA